MIFNLVFTNKQFLLKLFSFLHCAMKAIFNEIALFQ
jgi:hypothetical protein